jgi:rhodanese-related sulfurtransferase
MGPTMTIDELLAAARSRLDRLPALAVADAVRDGARLVDIRPEHQRRADGELPDAIVIERVQLEWRLDPTSEARISEAADHDVAWILVCDEGYSSSLAAATLHDLGLRRTTDVIGGFRAWRQAGLPVVPPGADSAGG